jgi:hypothetical protein
MLSRRKILILIPAIVLIPILLGMTPMNLVQKLSSRCPISQCKQIQRASSCLFHSIVSQDDFDIPSLNSSLLEKESTPSFDIKVLDPDSIHSNLTFNSVPLRC